MSPALPRVPTALTAVLLATVVLAVAWWRPIDGDEGYYAAAAGLVAEGEAPYSDFFFPQGPLVPAVYAPAVKVFGPSLRALRGVSVVLVLLAAALWTWHLRRHHGGALLPVVLGVGFLLLQPHALSWGVTVKTYAVTGLCVSAAWVALAEGLGTGRRWPWLLAAGVALGLAGSARSLFAPLGPVVAVGLLLTGRWAEPDEGPSWRGALLLLGGWLVGSLPLIVFWLRDPAVFMFNNLGYHELRFSELRSRYPDPSVARRLVSGLSGFGGVLAGHPFLLLQTVLLILGGVRLRRLPRPARRFPLLVALASMAYVLVCLAPDPVHAQYFGAPLASLGLPLTVLALVGSGEMPVRRTAMLGGALAVLAAAVFLGQRPGMDDDPVWTFEAYDRVVAEVKAQSPMDGVVFSLWPGYVFGSGRAFLPGFENHFAVGVSAQLTAEERIRYRIAGHGRIFRALDSGAPTVAVFGTWPHDIDHALDDDQMLRILGAIQENYEMTFEAQRTTVWARRR